MYVLKVLNDVFTSKTMLTAMAGLFANNQAETTTEVLTALAEVDTVDMTMGATLILRIALAMWRGHKNEK